MTFWIQHGYGKTDKIQQVARRGLLTGVIVSPAAEKFDTLRRTIVDLQLYDVEALLDPQLYIHTIAASKPVRPAILDRHKSHRLDYGNLTAPLSSQQIRQNAEAILLANQRLGSRRLIAPSPYQTSFGDEWTRHSIAYAQETIAISDRPVLISIVAENDAFADWQMTEDYIDAITALGASGVYLVVGTSSATYPLLWSPDRLANILRVVYTLTEFNNLDVVWGYSDIGGVLSTVCSGSGAATGWYHLLRMWKADNWAIRGGGMQAKTRVFVDSLFSSIERVGEATSIARAPSGGRVFSEPELHHDLLEEVRWTAPISQQQHLMAMAELHASIDLGVSASARISDFRERLTNARDLLYDVTNEGAAIAAKYGSQLDSLVEAIDLFASYENL